MRPIRVFYILFYILASRVQLSKVVDVLNGGAQMAAMQRYRFLKILLLSSSWFMLTNALLKFQNGIHLAWTLGMDKMLNCRKVVPI